MFHILQEMGAEIKVSNEDPLILENPPSQHYNNRHACWEIPRITSIGSSNLTFLLKQEFLYLKQVLGCPYREL